MISGATGAMGVVVVALVATHGIGYLFPAVILCGIFQVAVGLLRLGKLIRIVPHPVMLGFVNGLALVILLAQVGSFKTVGPDGAMAFLSGTRLWLMLAMVALTMAIIAFLPRLTRAVPSSLAAIVVVSLAALAINANANPNPAAPAAEPAPRSLLTVGDMLLDSTRAAAVNTAQRDKDTAALAAANAALPPGVAAVPAAHGPVAPLTPDETAAALATVDPAAIGIAGGLPRPAWWDFTLPPSTSTPSGSSSPSRSSWQAWASSNPS